MNKKLIFFCIFLGFLFSCFIYGVYAKNRTTIVTSTDTVYFIQYGAFKKESNVINVTKSLPSFIVLEEESLFKIYISILKNKENIEKLKAFYPINGVDIFIREVSMDNKEFLNYLSKYDELISKTNDSDTFLKANKNILTEYEKLFNES